MNTTIMPKLATMKNWFPWLFTEQTHILPLPECCPISHNPKEGSTLTISYIPSRKHLEVYALTEYINSFIGGKKCPVTGAYLNRDMESMIQAIAQHCANSVKVPVSVTADLVLDCHQMKLVCKAKPEKRSD